MRERIMHCPIWYCLPEIVQLKLRALAPADWCPPGDQSPFASIENTGEIDRLMRQTPSRVKRGRAW
ncbi:hypothetical protein [Dehalococcoides mccartyi]|uniref:hypothetical protein n=1 Tax=Dehalococcoides mccartyi TaxID=61435 RepID=UPI0007502C51|nr:hypothetical protein [Dehalococcoides mccartyi]